MAKSTRAAPNAALREFHKLGQQVLAAEKSCPPRGQGRYHYGSFGLMNERTGRSRGYLLCARRFAQQYPAPTKLTWICGLGQRRGRPLCRSHVIRLIVVRDRRQRDRLAQRCAIEMWSTQRLALEVQKVRPKRAYGGRRPPKPPDVAEALAALNHLAGRWMRWFAVMNTRDLNTGATLQDLPAGIRRQLTSASQRVSGLEKAVRRALQSL